MQGLSDYETTLLDYLRKEADAVKDCFTRFSFQVVAVSTIALGLVARFQPNYPLLGLASVGVVLIALSVGRIGAHKYATANRIHGYELYLDRIRRLRDSPGWKGVYREIGWEEAVRAWRTVQPTVFRLYYNWGTHRRNTLKTNYSRVRYPWFEPEKLHSPGSVYYAGSYLRTMLSILFMIVALGILSMTAMCVQILIDQQWLLLVPATLVAVVITVMAIIKMRQLSQRRRLLEGGILCIHSCAIVWQLVVTAHHRAVGQLPGYQDGEVESFEGYTRALSAQASTLRTHLENDGSPHDWIHRGNSLGPIG